MKTSTGLKGEMRTVIENFSWKFFGLSASRNPYGRSPTGHYAEDGGLAQLARAPALHAGGQRFESVILHQGHRTMTYWKRV